MCCCVAGLVFSDVLKSLHYIETSKIKTLRCSETSGNTGRYITEDISFMTTNITKGNVSKMPQ
jgi:hypothetical protein